MSYSPGPWRWGERDGSRTNCLYDRDGMCVMDEFEGIDDEHDRRLIAAAPEMAELLRDAIDDGERGARTYDTWRERVRALLAPIDGAAT